MSTGAGKEGKHAMEDKVLITDIVRFAVNDGPGFRTNVFLKGCTMNCAWCHNPETKVPHAEIYWKRKLCVQCGSCLDACPDDAVNAPVPVEEAMSEGSSYHKIDRKRCTLCMRCVHACRFGALEIVGRPMSVGEILEEVEKDSLFYLNSGGGMTVSGGEPAANGEFSLSLLEAARDRGIHTCLDTSGYGDPDLMRELAERADIVLFDLKHIDSPLHESRTGVGNELILENLSSLSVLGCEMWVRIPVVPGFNDSIEFHRAASTFLSNLPGRIRRVDLLPFHNWCQDKYSWMGIDWEYRDLEALDPSFLEIPADVYREKGFMATIGGSGFEGYGDKQCRKAGTL